MTQFLELEDAIELVTRAGFYVKDLGLLDSALARPKTTLFGEDAYPELELKAAALVHSVIKNHPMTGGSLGQQLNRRRRLVRVQYACRNKSSNN
mgnify:CR=1 FL=1